MATNREIYVGKIDEALAAYKQSCLEISKQAKLQIENSAEDKSEIAKTLSWQKAEIESAHDAFTAKLHSIKGEFFTDLESTSKQIEEAKLSELDGLLDQV